MKQVIQLNKPSENLSINNKEDLVNNLDTTVGRIENLTEQLSTITPNHYPFHLSMCVMDLDSTRHFYCDILGVKERRATKSSIHLDFYGCQLTFHEMKCYDAGNVRKEVDCEDVPIPHFGAAIPLAEYERIKESLIANNIDFFKKPRIRFINEGYEQHVMFILDPSGNGIEIKSFTKAEEGTWA